MNKWLFLSGINGALAVLLGAFAAHAMTGRFSPGAIHAFDTGAHYHLIHAVALGVAAVAIKAGARAGLAASLFQIGIALFSGSLYLWAVTGIRLFVFVTPIGGLALVAGWLALAVAAWRMERT